MHVEFQVEEPSMEEVLHFLVPQMLHPKDSFKIINYGSKQRLLRQIQSRLRAYRRRMDHEDLGVLVLVDCDNDSCVELKMKLDEYARVAGLRTKTNPNGVGDFRVVNRIVMRELEGWYLGDFAALLCAFPRLPDLSSKVRYRKPDEVVDAWEKLHHDLKKVGELGDVFPKIETARRVAPFMSVENNRSVRVSHNSGKGCDH